MHFQALRGENQHRTTVGPTRYLASYQVLVGLLQKESSECLTLLFSAKIVVVDQQKKAKKKFSLDNSKEKYWFKII